MKRATLFTAVLLSTALLTAISCQVRSSRTERRTIIPFADKTKPVGRIVYKNPSAPIDNRVADLISRMTLEEKVSQTLYNSPAIERLDVPEYNWWNECLHGVGRAGRATVFPQAIGMAATFDEDLILRI